MIILIMETREVCNILSEAVIGLMTSWKAVYNTKHTIIKMGCMPKTAKAFVNLVWADACLILLLQIMD